MELGGNFGRQTCLSLQLYILLLLNLVVCCLLLRAVVSTDKILDEIWLISYNFMLISVFSGYY